MKNSQLFYIQNVIQTYKNGTNIQKKLSTGNGTASGKYTQTTKIKGYWNQLIFMFVIQNVAY